jgi:hypothetical protein
MTRGGDYQRPNRIKSRGTCFNLLQILIIITFCSNICKTDAPIALYVGIRLADSSYHKLKEKSLTSLNLIYQKFQLPEIKADIDEIIEKAGEPGSWVYSYEPHFTTQYLGGQLPTNPVEKDLYLNFEEDIPCKVSVPAVAYLPGNILAGIGFMDLTSTYMLNDFPHTTLFNKGMSAKYSNDLLVALGKDPAFMADYKAKFASSSSVKSYQVEIEGKSYTAYVAPLQPAAWSLLGYTHKFYTA